MRTIILVLSLIFVFSLLSCDEYTPSQPEENSEAKIKRKLFYDYIEDTIPLRILEYKYDNEMKLERIYHCPGSCYPESCIDRALVYELFEYNKDNEMVNKYTYYYANDSLGWLLSDSTHYSYENGNIILEETFYFTIYSDHICYKYKYENSHLIKKYKYYNQQLQNYTIYDYSGGLCVKETMFKDSLGINLYEYTIHHYENGILIKSEKFDNKNNKIQLITYTYDDKGNLTIEESKQLDLSIVKQLFYVIRYEYY